MTEQSLPNNAAHDEVVNSAPREQLLSESIVNLEAQILSFYKGLATAVPKRERQLLQQTDIKSRVQTQALNLSTLVTGSIDLALEHGYNAKRLMDGALDLAARIRDLEVSQIPENLIPRLIDIGLKIEAWGLKPRESKGGEEHPIEKAVMKVIYQKINGFRTHENPVVRQRYLDGLCRVAQKINFKNSCLPPEKFAVAAEAVTTFAIWLKGGLLVLAGTAIASRPSVLRTIRSQRIRLDGYKFSQPTGEAYKNRALGRPYDYQKVTITKVRVPVRNIESGSSATIEANVQARTQEEIAEHPIQAETPVIAAPTEAELLPPGTIPVSTGPQNLKEGLFGTPVGVADVAMHQTVADEAPTQIEIDDQLLVDVIAAGSSADPKRLEELAKQMGIPARDISTILTLEDSDLEEIVAETDELYRPYILLAQQILITRYNDQIQARFQRVSATTATQISVVEQEAAPIETIGVQDEIDDLLLIEILRAGKDATIEQLSSLAQQIKIPEEELRAIVTLDDMEVIIQMANESDPTYGNYQKLAQRILGLTLKALYESSTERLLAERESLGTNTSFYYIISAIIEQREQSASTRQTKNVDQVDYPVPQAPKGNTNGRLARIWAFIRKYALP